MHRIAGRSGTRSGTYQPIVYPMPLLRLTRAGRLQCLALTLVTLFLIVAPGARAVAPSLGPRVVSDESVGQSAAPRQPGAPYSYSALSADIARREVASATFSTLTGQVQVKLRTGARFTVGYPPGAEQALSRQMIAGGARASLSTTALPHRRARRSAAQCRSCSSPRSRSASR